MYQVKEKILQMQNAESVVLKEKLEAFFLEMRTFRNDFRKNAPFAFSGKVEDAYACMDNYSILLAEKVKEASDYNELEDLEEAVRECAPGTCGACRPAKPRH